MKSSVTVSIVSYNSADLLRPCVERLWAQQEVAVRIVLVDNDSADDSVVVAQELQGESHRRNVPLNIIESKNKGYGGGHNTMIRWMLDVSRNVQSSIPNNQYIFLLNPDALLADDDTLATLVEVLRRQPAVGAAGPRLLLKDRNGYLDSTGFQLYRDRRLIDRDKEEKDVGQHMRQEVVFGLTGAAVLYRLETLLDVAEPKSNVEELEFFDESFFMYKEDLDLAWRMNWRGWQHVYCPAARVWHGRTTRGRAEEEGVHKSIEFRKQIDSTMLYYAFRNHRLAMIKNEDWLHYLRDLPLIMVRELLFAGYLLVHEPSTFKAYWSIIKNLPQALRKRRWIMRRRIVDWRTIDRFFVRPRRWFWFRLIKGYISNVFSS